MDTVTPRSLPRLARRPFRRSTEGVSLYGGGDVIIPGPGSAKTYVFEISGEKAELGVIIQGGNICEMGTYNIPPCSLI